TKFKSGQRSVPRFSPGEPAIRQKWRPPQSAGENRQRRVGGAHLAGRRDSVNTEIFAFMKLSDYQVNVTV
ncbi:hypothetical protein, partial [Aurantiacibacter flavus]